MTGARIPVHILTGFLGSGKTTLLNGALSAGFGAETAVIVNEFGEIGLDQIFIQERSDETIVLKSGCVCCSIRTDLVSTLMQLAGMRREGAAPFARIVIETSGISDPAPILSTLRSDFNLLTRFSVGTILCAIDPTAPESLQSAEAQAQIAAADACIVTKRDMADEEASLRASRDVQALNPCAEMLSGDAAALIDWLVRAERAGPDFASEIPTAEARDVGLKPHAIRSIVLRDLQPQSWPSFAIWLSGLVFFHGDRILRVKGVLYDEARATWIGVNGVRRVLYPPQHLALSRAPQSACLVFITDGLDPALIAQSYRKFVAVPEGDRLPLAAATRVPSLEGVYA